MIRVGLALSLVLITVLAVRAFDAWRAPPLSLWHTETPDELDADQIDAVEWPAWMAAESRVFDDVRTRVTDQLPAADRSAANRYFAGSPMHASHFATDWNRSYVQMPAGAPRGAAVLLHGLTDSPYSLRHVGAFYRQRGFAVVSIRMPGHGTVPAGLIDTRWADWMAATRLAVRHARTLSGADTPLHLVGYSNGGALALKYALDSLDEQDLARPDQLVLLSPMVGITSFARFAGVLGWPAIFPGFAKAAWLDTLPEYNPFKYNSFPVNGARQSSQLVRALQEQMLERVAAGTLGEFPRVLAFQSVVDATVFTEAVIDNLFRVLPANGSELVLFDLNHEAMAGPLLRPGSAAVMERALAGNRGFTLTLVTSSAADAALMEARSFVAGADPVRVPLPQSYPRDMYSLSHVALPFPMHDPVYGLAPAEESYGVRLGMLAVRGERDALVVGVETLMRAMCNPFFDYQLERIGATLVHGP